VYIEFEQEYGRQTLGVNFVAINSLPLVIVFSLL
jgi:hypothetical protein